MQNYNRKILFQKVPNDDWEHEILTKMILHPNNDVWEQLSKYNIAYKNDDNIYFPTNIELINIGSFSAIYEIKNTNYVLKITNNVEEYNWSQQLVKLQSTKKTYVNNYVKIFDIVKSDIKAPHFVSIYDTEHTIYFIVLEKMVPLNSGEIKIINELDKYYTEIFDNSFFDDKINVNTLWEFMELDYCAKYGIKYIKLIELLIQLGTDIGKMNWKDFHIKNIMKTNENTWKIIDLQKKYCS